MPATIVSLLLTLIVLSLGCAHMEKKDIKVILSPYKIENESSADSMKLMGKADAALLFYSVTQKEPPYETVIFSVDIAQPSAEVSHSFEFSQLLPPPPRWDIATGVDGIPVIVFESFGGATNQLLLKKPGEGDVWVTEKRSLGTFREPRFFKLSTEDSYVVTIRDEDDVVVFPAAKEGGYGDLLELGKGYAAVIKPLRGDFLLFHKVRKPGKVRLPNIPRGNLLLRKLDKDLKLAGQAVPLLGETNVFEFDVAVFGDHAVLFATTDKGFIFAVGSPAKVGFEWKVFKEIINAAELIRPAILAQKEKIYLAVLEKLPDGNQRLLTGSVSLDELL